MEGSRTNIVAILLLAVVLYALVNGHVFGYWFHIGSGGWLKWLFVGLIIWAIISLCSSARPRSRRKRYREDQDGLYCDSVYSARSNGLQEQLNDLRTELADLRRHRSKTDHGVGADKIERLTERVNVLEKIVTRRGYQLDDEIDRL